MLTRSSKEKLSVDIEQLSRFFKVLMSKCQSADEVKFLSKVLKDTIDATIEELNIK